MHFVHSAFRPFFLLASLAAVAYVPLWLASLRGIFASPLGGLSGTGWHAHHLLVGVVGAVFGGFFLTAVPKWTGRPPVSPPVLMGLALGWLVGRLAPLLGGDGLGAAADALYLLGLSVCIAAPVISARRWRNIGFPVLVAALGGAALWSWMGEAGVAPATRLDLRAFMVHAVLTVIAVFGGRITPMFTRNAIGGVRPRDPRDDLALGLIWVAAPLSLWGGPAFGGIAVAAGLASLVRQWGWNTLGAARDPLMFMLHVGHGWLGVGLLLEGLHALRPDLVPPGVALHALTVGAIGSYILGMMARVTLGHTGRPLQATTSMVVAFSALQLAALTRTLGIWLAPQWTSGGWAVAGGLWTLAFAVLLGACAPMWLRPRVDGKPG